MVERFKSLEGKQLIYQSYDRLLELWGVDKEELDIDTMYGKTHIVISGNRDIWSNANFRETMPWSNRINLKTSKCS